MQLNGFGVKYSANDVYIMAATFHAPADEETRIEGTKCGWGWVASNTCGTAIMESNGLYSVA